MALPANFLEELRARTPIVPVVARTIKLTRSGREHKGCCPFHGEKTPSFYVYEDHFHCFGCGEHGDVITFVMKTTGSSFMDAVEELASQAGMEVPKPTRQAAEAEIHRAGLAEVLEMACREYQLWLWGQEGATALAYLRGRGLTDETIRRFQLGWSGAGRGALAGALRRHDITTTQLIDAGLMKQGERGPVDMFFGRVMFPIRDRRGGLISFGGRIMGDGQPKYVNGPETAVFSKRRSLYGLNLAREALRKAAALIVVEGYMDVIALSQAGFGGAVAPLGTALTEEHLEDIWKLTPEPVVCFDGDAAGRRAALRTVELALTRLTPERSLKILNLPAGDDPDSLVKRGGRAGFETLLAGAKPLASVLYDMLKTGQNTATPEGRVRFRQRLFDAASVIPDKMLASEYRELFKNTFAAQYRTKREAPRGRFTPSAPAPVALPPRTMPDAKAAQLRRARVMLAILLDFPELIPDVEEAFSHVGLSAGDEALRLSLHEFVTQTGPLDRKALETHLRRTNLNGLADDVRAQARAEFRLAKDASPAEAARSWWSLYELMDFSIHMLSAQRDEAQGAWLADPGDKVAWDRLVRYNQLLERARSGMSGAAEL